MGLITAPSRPEDDDGARGVLIAPALARAIVAVVFCCFAGVALLWVLELEKSGGEMALAVTLLAALLGLQYFYFCRPGVDLRSPASHVVLAVQACLVYLPLGLFGQAWVSQPSFLAGSVLLVLAPRVAWPVYAAVVASTGVTQRFWTDGTWLDVVYVVVNTATAGLAVYGLVRLARLVTALYEARGELAKTAVAHERLRLAQDVHDLLGSSLSAIAPKGELALRLLRRDPGRARQELSEILEISRQSLTDLRSIARIYRDIDLDGETTTLTSMLAASNVELRLDLDSRELVPPLRAALAAVLREGVAHVLRHRQVERCEIVLRQEGDSVSADILYDYDGAQAGVGGDLPAMVSRMGGELTAEPVADGRFRLHVLLPVTARPPDLPAEAADEPRAPVPRIATRLGGGLVVAVFLGLFAQAVLRPLLVSRAFEQVAVGTGCLIAALVLQLAWFSRPGVRLRRPTAYLLLGLQAFVVYLPFVWFHEPRAGLQGFVAGSALLVLRPVIGWSVFAAVTAAAIWAQFAFVADLPVGYAHILVTVNLGLLTYGLTWMARSVLRLRDARRQLAEAALAEARLRFAQDLHDLLGLSLSAITLKSDLAHRLIPRDPDRARTVLAEVLEICRRALADVRSVAGGHREMSLDEECRTAESLLASAGLDVRMDVRHGDLPAEVGTVLATVLREGVTNVLRHSKGTRCEITVREEEGGVLLRIVNDGTGAPPQGDHRGSGIRNLSDRVAALGGTLTAGPEGDGRFGLSTRIPRHEKI
ncbi:sensor histidine kinase [Nonomuraea sp. NPDC050451]|uniref:sensor histidine kinase n=1 Tax=Nonomuraea sp. NPDC050451 TaxID=3364364 RepID=UPI003788E583